MKEEQDTLLHIFYCLENQNQPVSMDSIKRNLSWSGNIPLVVEDEIKRLIEKGYLTTENDNIFSLTDIGRNEAYKASRIMVKNEFSKKIARLTGSRTYLDYCEEVYGYRMYLFNMMDKAQLDFIINSVEISPQDKILDLGCGTGSVLNTLCSKYNCKGIGIDQLSNGVVEITNKMITYIDGDIDRLSDYDIKPSITIAIDSLYFSRELDNLIQQLISIRNNRLFLFYSQYALDESAVDRSMLQCDKTRLAEVLGKNCVSYETIDYSENEALLYEKSIKALLKYKKVFENEGNLDLFENKLREDMRGKEIYNKGLAKRYLYIVNRK